MFLNYPQFPVYWAKSILLNYWLHLILTVLHVKRKKKLRLWLNFCNNFKSKRSKIQCWKSNKLDFAVIVFLCGACLILWNHYEIAIIILQYSAQKFFNTISAGNLLQRTSRCYNMIKWNCSKKLFQSTLVFPVVSMAAKFWPFFF